MAHISKVVLCGKRLIGLIRSDAAKGSTSPLPLPVALTPLRLRKVHTTTYDKNIDEAVVQHNPTVVADHVIGEQPETYWGPHPHTGVFGPAGRTGTAAAGAGGANNNNNNNNPVEGANNMNNINNGPSVLDQEAWFRPVEGVDKPAPP